MDRGAAAGPQWLLYFDLTVSWSKDISLFHASLGAAVQRARNEGDQQAEALAARLLTEVDQILRDANNAALAYFQREAGYVRTGSHVARVDGRESGQWWQADLIVASWYQHTSRDGDMQLHEHNQIAHVAITRHDGKGSAPDSTAYYEHVRAAGQIASVHAEAALTRRFGMSWVPPGRWHGVWDRRHRCLARWRCSATQSRDHQARGPGTGAVFPGRARPRRTSASWPRCRNGPRCARG